MTSQVGRRGFTLIAVLVIVGSALLVATGMLFIAQAEVAGASHTARVAQSRSLMESALNVLVQELNQQRDVLLSGEMLELDQQYELYERGTLLGVVRLLPVTPDQRRVEPQASKLDINAKELTAEMLEATGLVDGDVAQAIIQYRDARPGGLVHSVSELLNVEGVSFELLFGPLEDMLDDPTNLEEGDLAERVLARYVSDEPRGLADVLTVFAVEPQLQRDGRRRINLNVPWSDELGQRLDDRFGEGAGEIIKSIMDGGTSFDDPAALYRVLVMFDVDPEEWPDIVDALATSEEEYAFGRVDINSASESVLRALPGMTPEAAAEIVRSREMHGEQERSTVAWPAMRGVVEPAAYELLGPWLTCRSWTFRVQFAVGEVHSDQPLGELDNPVLYEAVIDLAALQPRVAYLREMTMVRTLALLKVTAMADDGNLARRDWYDQAEMDEARWDIEPFADEADLNGWPGSGAALPNWSDLPDEVTDAASESWSADDSADEHGMSSPINGGQREPAPRTRLGRWRGG